GFARTSRTSRNKWRRCSPEPGLSSPRAGADEAFAFFRMRTTLKRGIGRGAAVNGNGRAVLPPAILTQVTRYRQPLPERRSFRAKVGRVFLWLVAFAMMVALAALGGAYLYYHQTVVGGLTAHSKDVRLAEKHL